MQKVSRMCIQSALKSSHHTICFNSEGDAVKKFLVGVLIAAGIMFSCSMTYSVTLEDVLKDTVPITKGICNVDVPKHGKMALECVKGIRPVNAAVIYAIIQDGEIIQVYEQVGQTEPKIIWDKTWKET